MPKTATPSTRSVKVDYLARVEGEGAILVKVKDSRVVDVKVRIFEPPRFFEAFLRGRDFTEAPDITARICGICPIAYQMSSCHAMERALGVTVGGQLRALRRLIYCGEWIESHVLHAAMLHAPDFLGYQDAIQMAAVHPEMVTTALKIKKIGNDLVALLGGREIHPINVRVGGFYSVPTVEGLKRMVEPLTWARDAAVEFTRFAATLEYPAFERDYEFVALRHPDEYPMNEGRIVSTRGLDIPVEEFEQHFVEEHVQHSNALHSTVVKRGEYHVGPLARFNLNFDRLSPLAERTAREVGIAPACSNPFKSLLVRGVETIYACEEALRIISEYNMPEQPAVDISPRAGIGHGCTEAPRGILYHRYQLNADGTIANARIVPPTSQNLRQMECDLRDLVPTLLEMSDEQMTWRCEQAVRNYDPCISCATHFLRLEVQRDESQ